MPLSDISVVDCGQVIAGPLCATFLADLGADVVKIEPPDGEMFRTDRRELEGEPFNPGFELFNRNKRAVSLDLKADEGREIVHDLVEKADIFVQNWPPGVAERLGVDYETLSEINEDIIYVHITGYGQSGPMTDLPGMDAMMQHVSGFSSMLGYEDHPPIRSQSSLADYFAAYNATISALGALIHRDRAGGQKIDVSLLESIAHNLDGAYEFYNNLGEVLSHGGRNLCHQREMLYGAAEADDGWVAVALLLYSDRIWTGYCEVLDRPDLLEDETYQTPQGRIADLGALTDRFESWLAEQPVDEAVSVLNENGIPAAPYQTIDEAAEMDQMEHLGVFEEITHPQYDSLTLTSSPLSLSKAEIGVEQPAPLQGQHNRDVLRELGYDEDDIEALVDDSVVTETET
ncbi:CaiB/BaiF CoA transferase family protein [Salinadaptatus halalkaliphilus]|uniref:CaiB/BaiF CoA transferase family protein n=1 Tax=Salinadaptatus halalkaliphilus TaxID=2419781 RepID=UPI00157FF379|nr:CoA transferase [Salinadaptatus halalkaliphilus]